jgi:hypothetical protein
MLASTYETIRCQNPTQHQHHTNHSGKSHILISFAKSEQNKNKRNEQIFVQGLYEIFIYGKKVSVSYTVA